MAGMTSGELRNQLSLMCPGAHRRMSVGALIDLLDRFDPNIPLLSREEFKASWERRTGEDPFKEHSIFAWFRRVVS